LPAHYSWADLLVQPSFEEGMSNVILEGLASGLPIVTTDVYGNRDLVESNRNGLLVRPGSSEEIASAIDEICADSTRLARFGERSRTLAERMSWATVASRYHAELRSVANSRSPSRPLPGTRIKN
jgi:glycosyltransferase involved in cell wall biosynthesis